MIVNGFGGIGIPPAAVPPHGMKLRSGLVGGRGVTPFLAAL